MLDALGIFDATVIVATHGHVGWADLARWRAIPSAEAEKVPVIHLHGETYVSALNEALIQVETEWVFVLDADDELRPGYMAGMARASANIRAPLIDYVHDAPYHDGSTVRSRGHDRFPACPRPCRGDCLDYGNWICKGAAAPTELIRGLGGWRELPTLDDYELWLRCRAAGATFEATESVYAAYVYDDSWSRKAAAAGIEAQVIESLRQEHGLKL